MTKHGFLSRIFLTQFFTVIALMFSHLISAQESDEGDILDLLPAILAAAAKPNFECTSYINLVLDSNSIKQNTRIPSGCYNVNSSISVLSGLLTIDPAVELRFASNTYLYVGSSGAIKAEGNRREPIIFSGINDTAGFWKGIEIENTSSQSNLLRHVSVKNGGDAISDSGIEINSTTSSPARIKLENVSVSGSLGYGIGLDDQTIIDRFSKVTMSGNRRPIYVWGNYVHKLGTDSKYTGNSQNFVYIEGDLITTSQTWKKLGVPYHSESIWVQSDLTLQAGLNLKFFSDSYLYVSGNEASLNAIGAVNERIVLEGVVSEGGYWEGVEFESTNNSSNQLIYVDVKNGGESISDAGIDIDSSVSNPTRIHLKNVSVAGSLGYGISVGDGTIIDEFSAVSMTSNRRPISIYGNYVNHLGADSIYSGNVQDFVYIDGDLITTNQTWKKLGVPYHSESIWVQSDLTLEAGLNLKFFSDSYLYVSGNEASLNAIGTVSERIVIEGGLNQDGYWEGIEFESTNNSSNQLIYVDVKNGGESISDAGIDIDSSVSNPARIHIENVSVTGSLGYGISVGDGTIIDEFSAVSMTSNRRPISIYGNYVNHLGADSIYSGNAQDFVYIDGDLITTSQTWKKLGVPYHSESIWVQSDLTLEAGLNLKFFSGAYLYIGEFYYLNDVGTMTERIVIEGVVNNQGYWDGIEFNHSRSSNNKLIFVDIKDGASSTTDANIDLNCSRTRPTRLEISNSNISNSFGYGIISNEDCLLTLNNNTFSNNFIGDINN